MTASGSGFVFSGDPAARRIVGLRRDVEMLKRRHFPDITSGGTSLLDVLINAGCVGIYPLNETSGAVAHDASGNGLNLSYGGSVTLGNAGAPNGDVYAHFTSHGRAAGGLGELPDYTGDFSAGVWFNFDAGAAQLQDIIGEGWPVHGAGAKGWGIYGDPSSRKLELWLGDGTTVDSSCVSNSTAFFTAGNLAVAGWHLVGVEHKSGTWKMIVDGVYQTATSTFAIANPVVSSQDFWLGDDAYAGGSFYLAGGLSYAFLTPNTSIDWAGIYNATSGNQSAKKVYTAKGDGTEDWEFPTIAVYKDGV